MDLFLEVDARVNCRVGLGRIEVDTGGVPLAVGFFHSVLTLSFLKIYSLLT